MGGMYVFAVFVVVSNIIIYKSSCREKNIYQVVCLLLFLLKKVYCKFCPYLLK